MADGPPDERRIPDVIGLAFVREAGLWFSIADARAVDDAVVATVRGLVEGAYGPWTGAGLG
jgi:hypothetical protein